MSDKSACTAASTSRVAVIRRDNSSSPLKLVARQHLSRGIPARRRESRGICTSGVKDYEVGMFGITKVVAASTKSLLATSLVPRIVDDHGTEIGGAAIRGLEEVERVNALEVMHDA